MASKKEKTVRSSGDDPGGVAAEKKGESKGKIKEAKPPLNELADKLEQTDEMKLKMLATLAENAGLAPQPSDALYPAELNAHLLDQLRVMTGENNQLRQLNFEKDSQIKELQATVADLKTRIRDIISGTGPTISSKSAGIISSKITDLCKQNRHLVAEIECYKTKVGALERKIMQLEMLNKENEKLDICLCKEDAALDSVSPEEMKELNVKLANVNKRLIDSKRKNLELKNEIVAATKILQNELGFKVTNLKELQHDLEGWKGRAEKIVLLQARVKELEERLNLRDKAVANSNKPNVEEHLKELEVKRKRDVEQALKEANAHKQENQELKKKLDAARCRIRNLECEHTTLRQKMQTYADKSNADDLLINEQRNQIKALEKYYQEILKENSVTMQKMHNAIEESAKLNENTAAKTEALKKQATEKARKIEELRAQLQRYEECSLQSVFFTPMRTATENEIKKLGELVVTLNERLDAERHKYEELEAEHRKLKEKKKRLEKKVSNLEEEIRQLNLMKRGSRASRSSLSRGDAHELTFASMKKGSEKSLSNAESTKQSSSTEPESPEQIDLLDKDMLKYRLLMTEEKLKSIEDKLKMVEEEKHEDYVTLTDMIQTSKQLFNDALVVLQKEKCLCH